MTEPTKRGPGRPRKTPIISKSAGASEPMEETIGQDNPRLMRSHGPARDALDPPLIEPVEEPIDEEKLERLAFNEQELVVIVHESTDPNADPWPLVCNDGIRQYFPRGVEIKAKRKMVEVLARAKHTTYGQRLVKDDMGNDAYEEIPRTALKFPFSVVQDPAGQQGKSWLKAILAQG